MDVVQNIKWSAGKVIELSSELEKPSPFYFGYDIQESFISHLEEHTFDKIFFFTEPHLFELYGKDIYEKLEEKFPCYLEFVPPGEKCKYFPVLEQMCENLIAKGVSKKSILLAFGGGTVGNVVGFTASLIYRGIRFVEIPTTMMAQTDSTLSNKQAVNGRTGKNHFGLYHAPIFIWADTRYLKTELLFYRRSGIAEGLKNGLISDPTFLDYLEKVLKPNAEFSEEQLTELAYRIILEYGHTFGHAIEWLQEGKLSHGESVCFGMKIAAELAREMGFISQEDVERHYHLIEEKLGFNNPFPEHITADKLMDAMIADNKKTGEELRFVILKKIGQCYNPEGDYLVTVDWKLVRTVLTNFIHRQVSKRSSQTKTKQSTLDVQVVTTRN